MSPVRFLVEGGHRLNGTIRPSGNKNAALPIIAAALLTDQPVELDNIPRIRDTETLVELIRSVGASAEWRGRNRLAIHAKDIRAADLDPGLGEYPLHGLVQQATLRAAHSIKGWFHWRDAQNRDARQQLPAFREAFPGFFD